MMKVGDIVRYGERVGKIVAIEGPNDPVFGRSIEVHTDTEFILTSESQVTRED